MKCHRYPRTVPQRAVLAGAVYVTYIATQQPQPSSTRSRPGRVRTGGVSPMGDTNASPPVATEIRVRRAARILEVSFADGSRFELPFEYLRVYSPSAEVRGHGPGQEVLVTGKENVGIAAVEPVGQYAVKLVFDDGHDTGLYTWKYLHELGRERAQRWARYLERCAAAGAQR